MSLLENKKILQLQPYAIIFFYLLAYFILNLLFLTKFPFVHSDEAWLSGLTRNMMENKSLWVTEPFFDLKPRNPHGFKTLFHVLQMPFITIFSYKVFSARLMSLTFSVFTLFVFYKSFVR